jgi:hypothetical protein
MHERVRERSDRREERLEELGREARERGIVEGGGVRAAGGPLPVPAPDASASRGYRDLPILKPPVWRWMIAGYFFAGGLAGMSGLLASGALLGGRLDLARAAMWAAGIGAVVSPILLTWDLGRPLRFVHMLRVFKYQSPMSVGSWLLAVFGAAALPGLVLAQWYGRVLQAGGAAPALRLLSTIAIGITGLTGAFLATYTGALLAVTAVPAWNLHRVVLPLQFGAAGLGSAVGVVWLLGFRGPALTLTFLCAAGLQTVILLWLEVRRHGAADRALHEGSSGWMLRSGEVLEGPAALVLGSLGSVPAAAIVFLAGALATRFGWLGAGRASALDPESVLSAQRGAHPAAAARRPYSLEPAVSSSGSRRK